MPQVAERIRSNGGEAHSIPGDVTAEDFPTKLAKGTVDKFGSIDLLVNNAGTSLTNQMVIWHSATTLLGCGISLSLSGGILAVLHLGAALSEYLVLLIDCLTLLSCIVTHRIHMGWSHS